jgi:hypothetical protein
MKLPAMRFSQVDWSSVDPSFHPGETGMATWRTTEFADLRLRMIDYSVDYLADHWCDRGHVLLVLEGELVAELRNGETFLLRAGSSFQVSDHGDDAHRVSSRIGAKVFIMD